jgi:hypothetical protein
VRVLYALQLEMYQLRDCVRRTYVQSVHDDHKVFTDVTQILTSIFERLTDELQQRNDSFWRLL